MSPHPPSRGRFSGGGFSSTADRWRVTPSEPFGGSCVASRWTAPQAWRGTTHTNIPNVANGAVGGKKRTHGEAFSRTPPAITSSSLPKITRSSGNGPVRPPQAGQDIQASPPKGIVPFFKQWSGPGNSQSPAHQNPNPFKTPTKQWPAPVHYQTSPQPQNPSHQNSNFSRAVPHSKGTPNVYDSRKPSSQPCNGGHDDSSSTKARIVPQQGLVIVVPDSDPEDEIVEAPTHRIPKGLPRKRESRSSSAPASKKAKAAVPDRGSRTTQTPQDNEKGSQVSRDVGNAKVAEFDEAEQARRLEAAQTLSNMFNMFSPPPPAPRPRAVPPFLAEDPDSPTEYTSHDMRILYNRYGPDILRAKQASYDEFGRVDPLPGDDDWAFDDEWILQWIPMKPDQEHILNVRDKEVLGGRWPDWLDEDGTVRYLTEVPLKEIVGTIGNSEG